MLTLVLFNVIRVRVDYIINSAHITKLSKRLDTKVAALKDQLVLDVVNMPHVLIVQRRRNVAQYSSHDPKASLCRPDVDVEARAHHCLLLAQL